MQVAKALIGRSQVTRAILFVSGCFAVGFGTAIYRVSWLDDQILFLLSYVKGRGMEDFWLDKFRYFGIEAIVAGSLVAAAAIFVLPRWKSVLALLQHRRLTVIASAAVLLALWLPVVVYARSVEVGGKLYWWLIDDAMISMRYARNLADGLGLVWNSGEYVEGYTNFLWTLYMALVHLLPIGDTVTSLVVLLSNIGLALATIPVIVHLVQEWGGDRYTLALTLAAYVLSKDLMFWAASGLEGTLLTLVFLISVLCIMRDVRLGRPSWLTYVLIASLSLIRADALVLSGLLYVIALVMHRAARPALLYTALSLVLPASHELFRIGYYGDVLPNTAYLKVAGWDGRLASGFQYVASFAIRYAAPIVCVLLGAIQVRSAKNLYFAGLGVLYAGYVVYVGGDWQTNFRFFAPIIALLLVMAFVSIQQLLGPRRARWLLSVVCLASIPLVIPGYTAEFFPFGWNAGNIRIGLLIRHNTPEDARVADAWGGTAFYFSQRYGVDLLGKMDRHIARLPVTSPTAMAGHTKFDIDYSLLTYEPDLIVADFKMPVDEAEMLALANSVDPIVGQLYFNEVFRRHCLPNPVPIDTFRTAFACDWSNVVQDLGNWRDIAGP